MFGITITLPKPQTSSAKADGRFGKQDFVYLPEEEPIPVRPGGNCRARWQADKALLDHSLSELFAQVPVHHRARTADGSKSTKLCSSALMQIHRPCASVEKQSSIRSTR